MRHSSKYLTPPRLSRRRCRAARRGLTLFELLLALAIFLASLAALAHLINTGSRAAIQGRLQTQAILHCESKLGEVLSGIEPMQSASNVPFPDDGDWRWSLEVEPGPLPELLELRLAVSHTGDNALANTSYHLTRYVRRPALFRGRVLTHRVRAQAATDRETGAQGQPEAPAGDRD